MRPEVPRERPGQAQVQAALMALITGQGEVATAPDAETLDAETLIVGDQRASAQERLDVYRFMYRARMIEALESQFPHLATHLGPEDFGELAVAYVADNPSTHPSLRFIGARLPGWLEARRPESPRLAALAQLEWARTDVFDLADEDALTLEAAKGWPAERFGELPLRLVTAHRVVTVPAGTEALWEATGAGAAGGVPAGPATHPTPGGVETLLVWRQETTVYHRVVEPLERVALDLAAAGTQFGAICEAFLAEGDEEEAVGRAHGLLLTWLADGLVRSPVA